jgi:hypothetical protein
MDTAQRNISIQMHIIWNGNSYMDRLPELSFIVISIDFLD